MSAAQLEQPVNSPIYDARRYVVAADKSRGVRFEFLRSPTVALIASALLMLLIGWIDYKTTDFAITVFYFMPVVLATWRAGRKAGWFIAALCGATVLTAARHAKQVAGKVSRTRSVGRLGWREES